MEALSPALKREAIELLFARSERIDALLVAFESQVVSASDLDTERRAHLLNHPDPRIRARAGKALEGLSPPDRKEVLKDYKDASVLQGDREKGRIVFSKVCATCHKAEGQGLNVGPDLATVAGRSSDDLLVHILDPNREVAPSFVNYTVATTDGRVFTGLIAEESANSLTLKRAEGVMDEIARNRIDAIASSGRSVMPEGLEKGLKPQDLADLIRFVQNHRVASSQINPWLGRALRNRILSDGRSVGVGRAVCLYSERHCNVGRDHSAFRRTTHDRIADRADLSSGHG